MKKSLATGALPEPHLEDLAAFGGMLRKLRVARGWPRADLAKRMLVSAATLQRMERGEPTVQIGIYAAAMDLLGLDDGWPRLIEAGLAQVPRLQPLRRARRPREEPF